MGRVVALDTNCFIYFLQGDDYPDQHEHARRLFTFIEQGKLRGLASIIALAEVLIGPQKRGMKDLADTLYVTLKTFPNLSFFPVDEPTALLAADLRAEWGLKMPDALQLATAMVHRANVFVTNDERLAKTPAGLKVSSLGGLVELIDS